MAAQTEKIVCKFIGDFKVGDNLILNADALCKLSASNEKRARPAWLRCPTILR